MAIFGNWTPITFINTTPPAIDQDALNDIESWIDIADEENRKSQTVNFEKIMTYFWQRNINEIENFSAASEWTADASTTLSDDTTNNVIGSNAVKLLESDNVASWVGMSRNITALDLTKFHDGSASTTADLIMVLFYVTDITKYTLFQIKLGTSNAHNYNYAWNPAGFTNGWNVRWIRKSVMTTTGAPAWNNITYLRVDSYSTINAQNQYFTLQYLQMIRADPDFATYTNAFQEYFGAATGWISKFSIYYDLFSVIYDEKINRLGTMKLVPADLYAGLHIYCSVLSFQGKFEIYSKLAGYTNSIVWMVDATNYIECYVNADTFYLNAVEGGAATPTSIALTNGLLLNERVLIGFEKDGDVVRAILSKNGEPIKILEYETSIADEGCLYLGTQGTSAWGLVTDFAVTNNAGNLNIYNEEAKGPRLVRLSADQSYANNTMTAIADFLIRLKPNRIYKIEAFINAHNAGSELADLKTDWSSSGVSLLSLKNCVGSDSTAASSQPNTTKNRCSAHALATAVRYELSASTTEVAIKEDFIVKTTQAGAYINMRAAQYATTAGAGNETIVDNTSYVLVTEVFIEK